VKSELKKVIKGRDEVIDAIVLGLASNEHILIIGKHGEAKTMLVRLLGKITGLKTFEMQVHQETIVKDVVGLLNPIEYKKGKLDIIKTNFWDAEIQFYDEFLRGRTEFLDFLLEVMVERQTTKTVLGLRKLPVISVVATSNPLTEFYNTERMDLALKDRFYAILNLNHLIENGDYSSLKEVLKNREGREARINITRNELIELKNYAIKNVKFDADVIIDIFRKLNELGFPFSTRTIKLFKNILQVNALMNGREEVEDEDYFYISNLMLSNRFEKLTKEKIENAVDESLVSFRYKPLVSKINKIEEIRSDHVFIESVVEMIEETKDIYPELPQKLKNKIDMLRSRLKETIMVNLKSIDPSILCKLDTEEFKTIIENYIDEKKIVTKYLNKSGKKKMEEILNVYGKNCVVEKITSVEGFVKFVIKPRIDNLKTFKEIENLKEVIPDDFFSQI